MKFRFPPRSSRGAVMGFTMGQILMVTSAVMCLVTAINTVADSPWTAGACVLAAIALFVLGLLRMRGRRITEWLPIVIGAAVQRTTRQDRYRGGIFGWQSVADYADLPGDLAGYEFLDAVGPNGSTHIALLAHRVEHTITAVLACSGSSYVLADREVQEQQLTDWADVLNTLGIEYGGRGLVRWSVMARAVPDTGNRAQRYLLNRAVEQTSEAYKSLAQLTSAAAPSAQRHEVYVVAVFDRKKMSREIADAGGTDEAAAVVVIEQLAGIEASVRDAGIASTGYLTPRDLAALLRTQFDPADGVSVDLRGGAAGEAGVAPRMAGPTAAETLGGSYYRHDSAISQTLWVYQMPRVEVSHTWLMGLFSQTHCRRTVTLVAEPVPASMANLATRRDKVARAGDETTKRKLRLVRTAREDAEARAVDQIDREQAAGHVRYRYALLVTVTATTRERLDADVLSVRRKLSKAGCEAVVLYLEQDQGFFAGALPLARGLRPLRGWSMG